MKIVFSILVHEKIEVVLNQIENFLNYNPNSFIILHLSKKFRIELGQNIQILESLKNVYINDYSIRTGFMDNSQFYGHFSNLLFLRKNKISFEFVCFHASNDMFVKYGLINHVRNYDSGSTFFELSTLPEWRQGKQAIRDLKLLKSLRHLNKDSSALLGSQLEGSFMNYDIFIKFTHEIENYNLFNENFLTKYLRYFLNINPKSMVLFSKLFKGLFYGKEEIYFPTFISFFSINHTLPYVYINWNNNLNILIEDVVNVRSGKMDEIENKVYFAVKRIERDMNDPIRQFINSLS